MEVNKNEEDADQNESETATFIRSHFDMLDKQEELAYDGNASDVCYNLYKL